jgi:hypothetical protein
LAIYLKKETAKGIISAEGVILAVGALTVAIGYFVLLAAFIL